MSIGFTAALAISGYPDDAAPASRIVVVVAAAVVLGAWIEHLQGLFLARISAVRAIELTRLVKSNALLGAVVLLIDRMSQLDLRIREIAFACAFSLLIQVVWRSIFRTWLARARARGLFCRRIAVIGADREALRLVDLISTHPELGAQVVGVIGDRPGRGIAGAERLEELWLGDLDRAEGLVLYAGVSGVVLIPGGIEPQRLNSLVRGLQRLGVHVQLAAGITGVDPRRLRAVPIAHEPLFYVEAPTLARSQRLGKRAFDIGFASLAIVLTAPLLAATAIALKAGRRGSVLIRRERVGHHGERFELLRFRTSWRAGESRRIERFVRRSGIDALPQLFNVIRGDMSLVGPRPASVEELRSLPEEYGRRDRVAPGISGLWQIETASTRSTAAHWRLDLFYVENWSTTLDLMILIATVERFVLRLAKAAHPGRPAPEAMAGGVE